MQQPTQRFHFHLFYLLSKREDQKNNMDMIMDCFFDEVFSNLERGSLLPRYKRRELVEYLSTVIQGCSRVESDPQIQCQRLVQSALRFHEKSRNENGKVCLMGKYHNVLHVAARIAYDWSLDDSSTVCQLLAAIFECEQTFERLITGSLFGIVASGVLSGYKSDFDSPEQNSLALRYFLNHSAKGECLYSLEGKTYQMVDVPMESYSGLTPVTLAMQTVNPEVVLLLLQHGAQVWAEDIPQGPIEVLLRRLAESSGHHLDSRLNECQRALMRVVPIVSLPPGAEFHPHYSQLVTGLSMLPERRTTSCPELKHLCRLIIREQLRRNFQLPIGVFALAIPSDLKMYLNLEVD